MKVIPVVRKAKLKDIDEDLENLQYWLSKTPIERLTALTQLRAFGLSPNQRMDKTYIVKSKLHQ